MQLDDDNNNNKMLSDRNHDVTYHTYTTYDLIRIIHTNPLRLTLEIMQQRKSQQYTYTTAV